MKIQDLQLHGSVTSNVDLIVDFCRRFSETFQPEDIPDTGGIYAILNLRGDVIYIGKAGNLRRRICRNHLSKSLNGNDSAFRRILHNTREMKYGPDMRAWIISNCQFVCLKVEGADARGMIESFLIQTLRSETLLNHQSHD